MFAGDASDASDSHNHGLRSERRICRNTQVDLHHADQGRRDTGELDDGSHSADRNTACLHRGGQLRGECPGRRGRARGNGRRYGARAGKVQAHHSAARRRGRPRDRPLRIGEHTRAAAATVTVPVADRPLFVTVRTEA